MKVNIADTIELESFSLINQQEGTTLSNNLQLPVPRLNVIVIHTFDDYETGQRGWGLVKDIAMMKNPQCNYPNYQELQNNSMLAVDAIKAIKKHFEEFSSHLDEYERQDQLGIFRALLDWTSASMFKENFLIFFSEFDVISIES